MALRPLDMQVAIGNMDRAGNYYLKAYMAPRKDQLVYETEMEERSKDIDSKVLDLPDDIDETQETYIDPHDGSRKRRRKLPKREAEKKEKKEDPIYHEYDKGNFVDELL